MVPSLASSFYWEERGLRCAVVCDSTHLRSGLGRRCCEHHKANTTLTVLSLMYNEVADAGATALAEALEATVWTCGQWLLWA